MRIEAWPNLALQNLRRELDSIVHLVQSPPPSQVDPVTAALARFLVVRTCGYLEAAVDECCKSLISARSAPMIVSYATSFIGTGRNPSSGKLVALVQKFSLEWGDDLRALLNQNDEFLQRELDLLVSKRNRIAHGLGEGIGARKALDLVASAKEVTDWFIERFDPR